MAQIKIIKSFYKTDAADLEQIVHRFAPVCKPLDNAQYKPQIGFYKFLPCIFVSVLYFSDQFAAFFITDPRQFGCIHSADLNFIGRHTVHPAFLQTVYRQFLQVGNPPHWNFCKQTENLFSGCRPS